MLAVLVNGSVAAGLHALSVWVGFISKLNS